MEQYPPFVPESYEVWVLPHHGAVTVHEVLEGFHIPDPHIDRSTTAFHADPDDVVCHWICMGDAVEVAGVVC